MIVVSSQSGRVLSAVESGPKTVAAIVSLTDIASGTVSRTCQVLIARGLMRRLNPGEPRAIYGLATENTPVHRQLRGAEFRALEDRYIDLRKAQTSAESAALQLGLSQSSGEVFEKHYRSQTTSHNLPDSSSPKWSHDEIHIDGVLLAGGYPAFSERRGTRGKISVCFPVMWPGQGIAA